MPTLFTSSGLPIVSAVSGFYALGSRTVITTTGASTFTPGSDTRALFVEGVGGGGSGGGAPTAGASGSAGTGGGGGSYSQKFFPGPLKTSYAVSVGTGATGGSGTGSSGNTTSFDSTVVFLANGGNGGLSGATAGSTPLTRQGGFGGSSVGAVGDLVAFGNGGGCSLRHDASIMASGEGGDSHLGPGGKGRIDQGDGHNGSNYGGGGGGAVCINGGSAQDGGNGAQGVLIIWEYV